MNPDEVIRDLTYGPTGQQIAGAARCMRKWPTPDGDLEAAQHRFYAAFDARQLATIMTRLVKAYDWPNLAFELSEEVEKRRAHALEIGKKP